MPVIAAMMILLSVAAEVVYRVQKLGEISLITSIVNWSCVVAFVVLAIIVRFLWWVSFFVCPILTGLIYYYFAYIDFDRTLSIVYFT